MRKAGASRIESKVMVYNRERKSLEEEQIIEKRWMDIFYGTSGGRFVTCLFLNRRWVSKTYGLWQKRAGSKKKIMRFIEAHEIPVKEIEYPVSGFQSFNDFFIRKLKPSARPFNPDQRIFISPADSRLLVYPIDRDTVYPIKGVHFSVGELVGDEALAKPYHGGTCLVFRLAPTDYHRFCYIDDGRHGPVKSLGGHLHSVNPVVIWQNIRVFEKNYREYCVLSTRNFGELIQIEVGALLVGKIHQHLPHGGQFTRGMEKGYFEFGGSTIILILEPAAVAMDEDIAEYSKRGIETLVKCGSGIGKKGP